MTSCEGSYSPPYWSQEVSKVNAGWSNETKCDASHCKPCTKGLQASFSECSSPTESIEGWRRPKQVIATSQGPPKRVDDCQAMGLGTEGEER